MRKVTWGYAIVISGLFIFACDDDDNDNNLASATDVEFAQKAGPANEAEIELGQVASSKGSIDGVRMFGQLMATEHKQALDELKALGERQNVTISTSVDTEHQAMKDKLMSMSGHAFDTAYIHSQVLDHQKTLALFQNEISNGKESSLKDYANKYLPHIQMHLNKADSIWNAINK
jgi:putative membrane protein